MAKVEVSMPKMGESITEGTVIEWVKKPGDTVELDETLLEIGTDKVDTEVPSPAAGVLTAVNVEEGVTVDVGTVIAIIETDASEAVVVQSPPSAAPQDAKSAEAAPVKQAEVPAAPVPVAAQSGESVDVLMPKMGESIMEGTVLTWSKQVGDAIDLDETLLEIATDKVDTEVPSPTAGIVAEILVPEGDTVDVGTKIAVIASGTGAGASASAQATSASVTAPSPSPTAAPAAAAAAPKASPAPAQAFTPGGDGSPIPRVGPSGEFYSPLVRAIAEKEGLSVNELAVIAGSGRESRVTKADVMSYLENRGAAPAPQMTAQNTSAPAARPVASFEPTPTVDGEGGRTEIIKMDRMRQIISEHMVRSKSTSAHVTSFAEIDVTNLVRLREANKAAFQAREGIKLTYTPFFVFAAVEALKDHAIMNSSVEGKEIHVRKDFHVNIAVAIGSTGLVAPVIRFAGQKNVNGLAHSAADLANRARSKKLQPDELSGGTFTVTNVGSLGSIMGTPIINQPQVGILATGAIKKRPVVMEDPLIGDTIAIRSMMYVSLSYDHRIIDGAMASSFLRRYTEVLESFGPFGEV